MGKIVLLDELTINQIAAGEVIERPASVVKELVENSIDAGANSITVEVQNGGIKKIRIIDNGSGMTKDDMDFAFERHATSKIRNADDLETVKSMGFRGEALASIAAIAHVEMISKTEDDEFGHKIVLEGGDVLEKEETGAKKGTTITVSNLFYNTPVRYKFLKKDYTELGYIEDAVTRIAIANPNVAIKLVNENKTIIQTSGNGDLKTVVYGLYGKEVSDKLIEVEYNYEDIKVTGVIGKPEIARSNRSYQMFFVNKRFIKDKTLTSGVEQAFKGLLPIGKYGLVILNLDINPRQIDVNVHPTKLEIRFQEEQKVFKAVYHTVREGLLKEDLVGGGFHQNTETAPKEEEMNKTISVSDIIQQTQVPSQIKEEKTEEIKSAGLFNIFRKKEEKAEKTEELEDDKENMIAQLFNKKVETKPEAEPEFKMPTEEQVDVMSKVLNLQNDSESKAELTEEEKKDFNKMYSETFGTKIEEKPQTEQMESYDLKQVENISVFEDKEVYGQEVPPYKYCGTIFSTYIIIEMDKEIYIIDQHAAHERIMYENVKKNYYSGGEKDSQIMLLPDIITLSHKEKSIVRENTEMFEKAGFIFEEFGENTIRLIGVPTICMELDTKELFLEILDEIDTVAITARQEKEDRFIATIACKAAVKANMSLEKEEIENLMNTLLKLPNPFTCPHGRPTAIRMTKYDIERKFSRK